MPVNDVTSEKNALRKQFMAMRKSLDPVQKSRMDSSIYKQLLDFLAGGLCSDVILTYVSTRYEADTVQFIRYVLENTNKKLAVPFCKDKNGDMDFYYIQSLDTLKESSMHLLEPDIEVCTKFEYTEKCVCLVPCMCFDSQLYRLGYGKGYYDKFLAKNDYYKIGLCYSGFQVSHLPCGSFDIQMDCMVTDDVSD